MAPVAIALDDVATAVGGPDDAAGLWDSGANDLHLPLHHAAGADMDLAWI